jgi:hypothetical protein
MKIYKEIFKENLKIMSIENIRLQEIAINIGNNWNRVLLEAMREGNVSQETVRLAMRYDKGTFSRIMSGDANMPPDRIKEFNDIVRNKLTIIWLCLQEGYEARVIPKTLEDQLVRERAEKESALKKVAYLEELLTKKKEG